MTKIPNDEESGIQGMASPRKQSALMFREPQSRSALNKQSTTSKISGRHSSVHYAGCRSHQTHRRPSVFSMQSIKEALDRSSRWVLTRQRIQFWFHNQTRLRQNWFSVSWMPEINTLEALALLVISAVFYAFSTAFYWGYTSAAFMAMPLLLIPRHNAITTITGCSYERLIKYHRWFGYLTLVPFVLHTWWYTYVSLFCDFNNDNPDLRPCVLWRWNLRQTYGLVAVLCFLVMLVLSLPIIRRKAFDFFYVTHFLWVAMVVMACMHQPGTLGFVAIPLVLYFVDKTLRHRATTSVRIVDVKHYEDDVCKIIFEKPFAYLPGQFAYFHFGRRVGMKCWHPLSFSSTPLDNETASITVQGIGKWTTKLGRKFAKGEIRSAKSKVSTQSTLNDITCPAPVAGGLSSSLDSEGVISIEAESYRSSSTPCERKMEDILKGPKLYISGPFGFPSVPSLEHYDGLLLIGGGIGVTPMMSHYLTMNPSKASQLQRVLRCREHRRGQLVPLPAEVRDPREGRALKGVRLLWAVPTENQIDWFSDELATMASATDATGHDTKVWDSTVKVFVTRQNELRTDRHAKACLQKDGYTAEIGRPDLAQEFQDFAIEVTDATQVRFIEEDCECKQLYIAVFVCGPTGLMTEVAALVNSQSTEHVQFHLHAETFEM
eukprot:Clim_evm8s233 gene=Clim_evmTU8s233